MQDEIQPLSPELWFARIEMIANGELASTESALRHALHLLQLAPGQFRLRDHEVIDEESYEALLGAGNLDAAARCLVAAPTLTVSQTSADGRVEVAIACRILNKTIFGHGDSVATAILQAWTSHLLTLKAELGPSGLSEAIGP